MTAAKRAKELGAKSLQQLSDKYGVSRATLTNWYKHRPQVFDALCRDVKEQPQ